MKILVLGKLNGIDKIYYWNIKEKMILGKIFEDLIEKYAIAENMNGYDLIKIVGIAYVDKEHELDIMGHTISKSVVKFVDIGDEN